MEVDVVLFVCFFGPAQHQARDVIKRDSATAGRATEASRKWMRGTSAKWTIGVKPESKLRLAATCDAGDYSCGFYCPALMSHLAH